jgi:alanine dehydrogenase
LDCAVAIRLLVRYEGSALEQGGNMIIGILKEINSEENRVSMIPAGVEVMRAYSHTVLVQESAGVGSGFEDDAYEAAGAELVSTAEQIYERADMVVHVKEPAPQEYALIRPDQIVMAFLHLAANKELTIALLRSGAVCIAFETIQRADCSLPLLTPMSEVAGRMAIQQGAKYLEMAQGGRGILLGGVPGVEPGNVLIIGGGTVGINAARMACGLGARVYILDTDLDRLRYLNEVMPANCVCLFASPAAIREHIKTADVVVGAVLIPGAKAPILISREMLKLMKPGSILVDVAIDQGGSFETSKPTTHCEPIFTQDGVVHYCVANMPGAVPRTSTLALTNASLPYLLQIANKGWEKAMQENPEIKFGANVIRNRITYKAVAEAFNLDYTPVDEMLYDMWRYS